MAEMTTLAAVIYRKYTTSIAPGFEEATPGITARFEVFYDDRFSKMRVSSSSHHSLVHIHAYVDIARNTLALSSFIRS